MPIESKYSTILFINNFFISIFRFRTSSILKKHKACHEEKKHACDICGSRFTRPESLRRHKDLHFNEKPFECDICSKKFARRYALSVSYILKYVQFLCY